MNKQYKKLGKNIALLTLGSIGSKLITFFLVPLYTSALTTEQYGVSDLIFTLYNLIMPILTIEVYYALMRFSLEKEANHKQIFTNALLVNVIGILLLFVLAPVFMHFEAIAPYFGFFVAYCATNSLENLLLYFARGIDQVRHYAIATLVNTIAIVTLNMLFLLVFKWGIIGYLMAYIVANFIAFLYLFVVLRAWRYVIGFRELDTKMLKRMAVYCIPLIPNTISWWISNQSDKFIIILFHGLALSGVYAIAYKIPSILNVFSSIFLNAWQISSVDNFGSQESKDFFSNVFRQYFKLQVMVTSGVILFSRVAAKILYQKDFYDAWHYVPILTTAVLFHVLGSFFASVYTGAQKTKGIAVSTVAGALINIALNFALIPKFHAYGAAIATLVSYVVIYVARQIHSRQFFAFEINNKLVVACSVLLGIQTIAASIDLKYGYVIQIACVLGLLVLCREFFDIVKSLVKRKMKK